MTQGKYSDIPLKYVRFEVTTKMKQFRGGTDQFLSRKRVEQVNIKAVNELFEDQFQPQKNFLKFPSIQKRIHIKDIAKHIGDIRLHQTTARDIRTTINDINNSGRLTISNDAGGLEKSKDRALTEEELKQTNIYSSL